MNNKKITIGVDLDDVLSDLVTDWLSEYKNIYKENIMLDDIIGWPISNYVAKGNLIYDILDNNVDFENLPVNDKAIEGLKFLNDNFNLYIVTATCPQHYLSKWKWISKYFPFININKIIITSEKWILPLDFIIDDNPNTVEACEKVLITPLVFDKPWNRHINKSIERVNNWNDIIDYFREKIL